MPSDLENSLIEGGLTPAAAKLISNAIDNAATGRLTLGQQLADSTPAEKMRLIDSNTRKYVLTNLDHPFDNPFRKSVSNRGAPYTPRDTTHPYDGSQPASPSPTLSTPTVKGGKFVSVDTGVKDDVSQAEVTLNVKNQGGQHARLNPATGAVESVPILVEVEPQEYLEATVEEKPEGTVVRIRLKPQEFMRVKGVARIRVKDSLGNICRVEDIFTGQLLPAMYLWTE